MSTAPSLMRSYIALTKPRLVSMVAVSSSLGFFLASSPRASFPDATLARYLFMILGVGLSGAGSCVLNQYLERDADSRMERTRHRPLPTGEISPMHALLLGVTLVLAGIFILENQVNLLTSFLVLLTTFLYVLVYTPLKRLTWLNTTVGAIPGAIPTLAGWAAATNHLSPAAWTLFTILFLWQHPHFFAIAWLYRDDYRQGDFRMLPVVEPDGASTFRQILIFTVLLIAASLAPAGLGTAGLIYTAGALLLGTIFLASGIRLARLRSTEQARALFHFSLLYLPCLLLLLAADSILQ
ncbi:MAG: heme o synthase [Candidatus Hydrogenedentota bacterium]